MKKQPSERARFEVLMEEVQFQLKVVAEGHTGLTDKFDRLDQKVGVLDQKVTRLEQKTEHGFATLGQRIGFVESAVLDVRGDIKRLDQRLSEHLSAHSA